MATVWVLASAWQAVPEVDQTAARAAVVVPLTGWLNEPARVEVDGVDWLCWDDPLLTEDHAIAVAAAVEVAD